MSHLPQEALHRAGTVHPLYAGAQGIDRQSAKLAAESVQHRDRNLRNGGYPAGGHSGAREAEERRRWRRQSVRLGGGRTGTQETETGR